MRIQWRALGKRHPIGTCAKDKAFTLGTGRGEHWLGELGARKSVELCLFSWGGLTIISTTCIPEIHLKQRHTLEVGIEKSLIVET